MICIKNVLAHRSVHTLVSLGVFRLSRILPSCSAMKSGQVKRPIHCKFTLTGFVCFLLLFPSLPPRQQDFLAPLLPLLQISFTSTDWHIRSMRFLFFKEEFQSHVSLAPLSILFISFLSFSLAGSPSHYSLSFFLTTGWRHLLRSTDSCLHPLSVSLHVSLHFLSLHLPQKTFVNYANVFK